MEPIGPHTGLSEKTTTEDTEVTEENLDHESLDTILEDFGVEIDKKPNGDS